ncbi:hypothetical protein N3K66_007765 [Trichothecium roseum]|uniref:Uncharacterized protein n=1 Tax=Trichothecium roseum TaxID=47278 RepID=A0ACC0UWJ8_9HYPO|nr:hypothetical protein N3K66_007765 [Trichothecium roseum]
MESKQPDLWAAISITFFMATVAIILRLVSRRLKRIPLAWDDYFSLCCYGMNVAWVIIIPYWLKNSLGLHITDVESPPMEDILFRSKLILYIAELFYAFALFFAKMSLLCLYWRMFRLTNIRLPIQILFGCSIIWITFRIFMGIWHCVPIEAFWDSSVGGRCDIEDKKFFFGTTLVHAVIDIALLTLPVMQISKLQLPGIQKLGIMVMFTFGIFVCAAAITLCVSATQFDATSIDLTWNIFPIVLWATVEVNLVTVSACLPTVRPACTFFLTCTNPRTRTGASSGGYSDGYGSRSRNNKQPIRLSSIPKSAPYDESSSTHQLADPEDAERGSNGGGGGGAGGHSGFDFDGHAFDRDYRNTAAVTAPRGGGEPDLGSTFGGIVVKNETTVQVSESKDLR